MSYILDALRKADAQRQRSRLPGLQAQATAPLAAASAQSWWRSPVAWAVGSGLLALGVVLAWREMQPVPPVPLATPASTAVQEPAPVPGPTQPQPSAPVAATSIQPAAPPARVEAEPVPRAATKRAEAPQRAPVQAAAPAASAAVAAPPAAPATAPAGVASTESAVAPAGAPKLTITGGVYSTNAAQRMLIVGGQVFNEGSEVAPGVVLEQVRPNQALLSFQGQRYTVRY